MCWLRRLALVALMTLAWAHMAGSAATQGRPQTFTVSPQGPYTTPADALAQAQDGDTIEVHGGSYAGPLVVERSVTLIGRDWPTLDGGGRGTVVKLAAPGIVLRGFVIRNSGDSLEAENSGIAITAPEVTVEGNRLEETLFGIYLSKAHRSVIRGNVIHSKDLPLPRRGDAIRIWYSDDVRIEENVVERGRDAVLWYSSRLTLRGNVLTGGRYGLHFMYCDDALIEDNRLADNSVGAFLMYSRRLHMRRNTVASNRGPSGLGLGLKDVDDAVIEENLFADNRVGVFVDNSPRDIESTVRFQGNLFSFNDIGVTLLPSVQRNQFTDNGFVDNQEQVSVAGGGQLTGNFWAINGRGNYWSDYVGYDGDGDGLGDIPYRAERLFENLMDRHPALRLFIYSPAAQAVDFAARAFPLVKPQPKLTDARPLMAPPALEGIPTGPRPADWPLRIASASLLALATALVLFPRPRRKLRAATCNMHHITLNPELSTMIHVHDLTKRFGSLVAVDRLSFEVKTGEAVALWGPNGAGKTTALRCLLGLIPYEGTVHLAGLDVSLQGKAARRLVGFVPQELSFHDDLTVRETMQFYARLKKSPAGLTEGLPERLGLTEHAGKRVRDLSGGMKQRLALALALLSDPPLLVLDEPTANLDARAREGFLALLAELKAAGKTLVFSSHRPEEMVALADRVLVMENGQLVRDCSPNEWLEMRDWRLDTGGGGLECLTWVTSWC